MPTPTRWSQLDPDDFVIVVLDELRRASGESKLWRSEAREDYDFYAGVQWDEKDTKKLQEQQRPVVVFNRTAPTIDSVSGSERASRQEVEFLPRTVGPTVDQVDDGGVSEMFTGAAHWIRDECQAEDEESHSFHDAIVCGMGWTETWVDYETDPEGQVKIERFSPLEGYWDPAATKANLSDSRWRARVKRIPEIDLKEIWPEAADTYGVDGSFSDTLESLIDEGGAKVGEETMRYRGYVPVVQFQWWEREPIMRIAGPAGEIAVPRETYDALVERQPELAMPGQPAVRRVYYQAFVAGSVLLERNPLHPQGMGGTSPDFTLQCITGKKHERDASFFGLMRQMKDPQRWANKWLSQTMHILNTGSKGGLLAEKGAFDNPRKAEEDWAKPEAIVWLADGALSADKPRVQARDPAQIPSALPELTLFAVNSIREVTGVNLEFLGLRGKFQPLGVEESRVRQGMTVLAPLFDNLRRYRKTQGRVMLHMIQTYIPDGRLIRVTGDNRYVPFRRDPAVQKYDIIIDESPAGPNQKQEVWQQMAQVLPAMVKAGLAVPPDILDYAPFPQSVINRMKTFYAQQAQASQASRQLAEQQQAAELQQTLAKAELARAQGAAALQRAATDQDAVQTDKFKALSDALLGMMETQMKAAQPKEASDG